MVLDFVETELHPRGMVSTVISTILMSMKKHNEEINCTRY